MDVAAKAGSLRTARRRTASAGTLRQKSVGVCACSNRRPRKPDRKRHTKRLRGKDNNRGDRFSPDRIRGGIDRGPAGGSTNRRGAASGTALLEAAAGGSRAGHPPANFVSHSMTKM